MRINGTLLFPINQNCTNLLLSPLGKKNYQIQFCTVIRQSLLSCWSTLPWQIRFGPQGPFEDATIDLNLIKKNFTFMLISIFHKGRHKFSHLDIFISLTFPHYIFSILSKLCFCYKNKSYWEHFICPSEKRKFLRFDFASHI